MSHSEAFKIDPISIEQVLNSDELKKQIMVTGMEFERMKQSHRAKEAWKRRREREYRAKHNEAFIYVRSSNVDVIKLQTSVMKQKAADLGLPCIQVFHDSCSGMTQPFSRSGFWKLMTALRDTPTVSKLVVWDETHLSRTRYDISSIKRDLKELGVELVCVEE